MGIRTRLSERRALRSATTHLSEELGRRDLSLGLLTERIAELELALEDTGWTEIGQQGAQEFSRGGLRKMVSLARVMFLKNPLIRRAVMVQAYYVFGQGVSVGAQEDEVAAIVNDFWDDPANRAELTSHQALELKEIELQTSGNIFLTLFTTESTGRVRVRSIPTSEVEDIITNPDDRKEPWFYLREWYQEEVTPTGARERVKMKALYPDWRYMPEDQPDQWNAFDVRWDSPVMHVKVGGLDGMRFGLPDIYAAMDWARAYKEFLEDWASIVRALSRFAWRMTSKRGKRSREAARKKLETTVSTGGGETNPPATTGAVFVGSEDVDLTPIPKTGATVASTDGRQLRTMVSAATDIPDTILAGDPDMGNLATAKTLDRPTELAMSSRQTMWADVFRDLLSFVLIAAARANELPGDVEAFDAGERLTPPADHDYSVTVTFPPILEHDVNKLVEAIAHAATLGGKPDAGTVPRRTLVSLLLAALAVPDADKVIEEMEIPEGGAEPAVEAQFMEALRELRAYLDRLVEAA